MRLWLVSDSNQDHDGLLTYHTVLRNPLYFVFLILLGAGAYVVHSLNLWGPLLNMTNAASAQALEEGKKRLREFLETTETGRSALAMPAAGGESYEMKRMNQTRPASGKEADAGDDEEI